MESLLNAQTQLLKHKLEEIRKLEEQIKLTNKEYYLDVILNGLTTLKEFKGEIKMPKIILAYNNPKLKIGDKVQVLTNADHYAQGTHSQTSAWGTSSETRFCNKKYTITEDILRRLKAQQNIQMDLFPELQHSSTGWVMHYADFKMASTIEIVETPVYQILKVIEDNISNIVLTPDKEQAETILKNLIEKNTDEKTKYTKLEFTLKKKIEKEYE